MQIEVYYKDDLSIIPNDILDGDYKIEIYNPLYFQWDNKDYSDYIQTVCKDCNDFLEHVRKSETQWRISK